uniref:Ig-like domain-containing protein n=1 Tax=Scleropages formosus TaxID=113540 RepID=A0A8C9SEP1_SCLFO
MACIYSPNCWFLYTFLPVLGPAQPVVAVAGEDVVLPCYLKPNISAVDLSVEWFRVQTKDPLVHLYRDHEDRNENQIPSYRRRTSLFPEELRNGNTSLKVKNLRGSDNGEYKCLSGKFYDDSSIEVHIKGKNLEFWLEMSLFFFCIILICILIHLYESLSTLMILL